jgi:hypothetical protein
MSLHCKRNPVTPAAMLALAVTAALLCCALFSSPAEAKRKVRPLYWGAQIGTQLTGTPAPYDMQALYDFEANAGKGLSLLAISAPFADCSVTPCRYYAFPGELLERIRTYGAIPFYNWASQSTPSEAIEPDFQLSDLIAGREDGYIRRFAEAARNWGHPFFLRFDWEMNGFWFPWNEGVNGNKPGEFVKAWRHVHRIFTGVGANNVNWVWCPNVDFTRKLTPLKDVYPGHKFVDWTCLDGFNWGDTTYSAGWMSFNAIFRSTYKRVARIAKHKPMLIAETASEERGGSKSRWIANALRVIPRQYPKVRGMIWFDEKSQGMNWPIESSPRATRAFARGISRHVYRPNLYANLPPQFIRPPRWR